MQPVSGSKSNRVEEDNSLKDERLVVRYRYDKNSGSLGNRLYDTDPRTILLELSS